MSSDIARRAAEQMREECAALAERCDLNSGYQIARDIRALPLPNQPGTGERPKYSAVPAIEADLRRRIDDE